MQSSPQRDVQFFAKKGGLIFRYEKNEYIFVIWALKGMSPVNLKKKFENFLRLHYWVKNRYTKNCSDTTITVQCNPGGQYNSKYFCVNLPLFVFMFELPTRHEQL